jgi:hypothetical protein
MHVGPAPPGTEIVLTPVLTNGRGRTNRDENASILQHFADNISASTRNVGVLHMKFELLNENRQGSLVSQISSMVDGELMREAGASGAMRGTYH